MKVKRGEGERNWNNGFFDIRMVNSYYSCEISLHALFELVNGENF